MAPSMSSCHAAEIDLVVADVQLERVGVEAAVDQAAIAVAGQDGASAPWAR